MHINILDYFVAFRWWQWRSCGVYENCHNFGAPYVHNIGRFHACSIYSAVGKCTRTNERGDETVEGVNSDRYCLGCGDSDDDVERGL